VSNSTTERRLATRKGAPNVRITRRHVYTAFAGVGILIGSAGIANAATGASRSNGSTTVVAGQSASADPADAAGETEGSDEADEAPVYTSSITVDDTAEATSEADEATGLAQLATVTPDEAGAAAVASTPGTAQRIELENVDGNVVYSVEVDTGSGIVDVTIDAGNGKVLATESDEAESGEHGDAHDGDEHRGNEANEAPGTEEADD